MKNLRYILVFLFMLPGLEAFSQGSLSSLGFWHQLSFNGELSLEGTYRQEKSLLGSSYENHRGLYGIAGIKLQSSSYLWLPDLVMLDLELEFNPATLNERYISIPNFTEIRTLGRFLFSSTIFNNKPLTLTPHISYTHSYFNREGMTNIAAKNWQWGVTATLRNKYIPIMLNYTSYDWEQVETETGRYTNYSRSILELTANKSFSYRDKNMLIFGHDDYFYSYYSNNPIHNLINRATLRNQVYIDSSKKHFFNSNILYHDQKGSFNFQRFEANELLFFNLPYDFKLRTLYNFYSYKNEGQDLNLNKVLIDLNHKLFLSLRSNLLAEYRNGKHTLYDETNLIGGGGFSYVKNIPFGRLNITYNFSWNRQKMISSLLPIPIIDEPHTLSDGVIELLEKPYADINSVVVKDPTGSIIYQLYFDYILVEINNYIEIQRVFGGQIPNNGPILVDYFTNSHGSYGYDLNYQYVSVGFSLFKNLLEIYYKGRFQDYTNVKHPEFIILNYLSQNIVGLRINKDFASVGIEYDDYNSSILPYKLMRYYCNLNGNINNKFLLSFNASIQDYKYIGSELDRLYANLSGKAIYNFRPKTWFELELGYIRQQDPNLDLSMWIGRLDFSTIFNKLFIKAGIHFYQRDLITSEYNLFGIRMKVSRKF